MRVAVVGAGSWGTALAIHSARSGNETVLCPRDPAVAASIDRERRHPSRHPDAVFPDGLRAEPGLGAVRSADLVLLAVPSPAVPSVLGGIAEAGGRPAIVSAVKGFEIETGRRVSELAAERLPGRPFAVLSGPTFADGVVFTAAASPATKSLNELLRSKDLPAVEKEFQRAMAAVESDPPAGVTAACSLLEALFKTIIEDEGLQLPSDQSIVALYKPVRDRFHLNPAEVAEKDLQRIMTGLISIVDGIGALRTHAGSAHGRGRQPFELSASHARLAINGAHTLAFFILETWGASKTT